jgi:hypothetical protein
MGQSLSDERIRSFNRTKNFSNTPILDPDGESIRVDPKTGIHYQTSGDDLRDAEYLYRIHMGLRNMRGEKLSE